MRPLSLVLLVAGVVLLVASAVLYAEPLSGLIRCPDPGVCYSEYTLTDYVPAIVSLAGGAIALAAAVLVHRRHLPRAPAG